MSAGGWCAVTHMPAKAMCEFARHLVEAAQRPGAAAAVRVNDFGIGIVCLGTPHGVGGTHEQLGLALFKGVTAALFQEHFEEVGCAQLHALQDAAWCGLDTGTKRRFITSALVIADAGLGQSFTAAHPAFAELLETQMRRPATGRLVAGADEGSVSWA